MVLPLLWALLAGLALALSYVTGAASFAWAGYLMLLMLVIGFALARLGERGLRARRQLSRDRVAFGERIEVELEVANASRLPLLWAYAADSLPAGLQVTGARGRVGPLGARRPVQPRYSPPGTRRGYYPGGPTVLRTREPFGPSLRARPAAPASSLIVFPKIVPIRHARFPSRRTGDVRTRHRVLEDPSQVVGIRPYQRTDGLKRVHWRATAHTGQLQSKLYELSAQVDTLIAVSLRRKDYAAAPAEAQESVELAMVTAASVCQHVLERRQRTGLLAVGWDPAAETGQATVRVPPGRGREQLAALLSVLGRMSLGNSEPLSSALNREKETLTWGSLVVVIVPEVGDELLRALIGLRTGGFDVSVLLVGRSSALS